MNRSLLIKGRSNKVLEVASCCLNEGDHFVLSFSFHLFVLNSKSRLRGDERVRARVRVRRIWNVLGLGLGLGFELGLELGFGLALGFGLGN